MKPKCFGFFHPNDLECIENCSFRAACQKYQELNLFQNYYDKYKKKKEVPEGLNIDDIITIDEDFLDL